MTSRGRKTRLSAGAAQKMISSWQDKLAEILVILMLCVQPLYFNQHRYRGLTGHKYNFFVLCMSVILCAVVLIFIFKIIKKQRLLPEKPLTVADWAILGFAAVTLLSALLSPFAGVENVWAGRTERHDGAITQLFYAAIFLIVAYWYKPRVRDFGFFGVSAGLIGLIGILQFYGYDFLKLWPNEVGSEYWAPNFYNIFFRSTLGNINVVSGYASVAALLCGFLFVRMNGEKKLWRGIWFAGSALCFWLLILSRSDSGVVAIIATAVLALPFIVESSKRLGDFLLLASSWAGTFTLQKLFYDYLIIETETSGRIAAYAVLSAVFLISGLVLTLIRSNKPDNKPEPNEPIKIKWKLGVILTISFIFAGVAGIEIMGARAAESGNIRGNPVYEAREILHGRAEDSYGSGRIYIWRNSLEAFTNYPVIGSGPDTFTHAFPSQEEAIERYTVLFDKAHNEYLQILVCQGILGLACYLVFLGSLFFKSIRKAFRNPLLSVVLIAFTGFCVQAFFNISIPIANQMLWVFAGMLACLTAAKNAEI